MESRIEHEPYEISLFIDALLEVCETDKEEEMSKYPVTEKTLVGNIKKHFMQKAEIDVCPNCGNVGKMSYRALADKVGITHSAMFRFMTGKSISVANLEKIWSYTYGNPNPIESE
ncbi:MAG: helix-turn-helix transcriptional regulator [Candidatus Scalindua sp.]|nr:helix-turn-helix transcriptional regulator [Candidatus Scalindua sp.]